MADIKEVIKKISKYKDGKPASSYKITTQSDITQIEPIYFWILDFIQDAGIDVKKVTDNFMASPGSGQFQDFTQRQSAFMSKAGEYMGAINQVTKSILNLIYDLKEFEIRLKHYEHAKSKDKNKKEEGMLALKNIWLDNVDMKRGNGSIHQMAYQMGFTTLREAFLVANSKEEIEKMASKDGIINDSVKRILIPRLSEFLIWSESSEKELQKRYSIEKNYLKSQVETLKMYTRWARPYLKALEELKMKGFEDDPSLVSSFSTTKFQLTLYGKKKAKAPPKTHPDYKMERDYYSIYVIDMEYRGHLGQKVDQKGNFGFGFGGRVDMTFDCYTLNSEELKLVEKELAKADVTEGFKFLEDSTQDTLKQIEEDIDHFVFDDKKKEEKKEEKKDNSNPFSALFSGFSELFNFKFDNKKKKEIEKPEDIKKDNYVEGLVRAEAEDSAKKFLYAVYDVYKKAHGMASSPEDFQN